MIGRAHIASEAIRHRALIEAALERSGQDLYTFRDVVDYLLSGRAVLWSDTEAVVVACIHTMPQGKSCSVWLAGGDLAQCDAIAPLVIDYARASGCKVVEIHGRPGWQRVLQKHGPITRSASLSMRIDYAAAAEPLPRDRDAAPIEPAAAAPIQEEV